MLVPSGIFVWGAVGVGGQAKREELCLFRGKLRANSQAEILNTLLLTF